MSKKTKPRACFFSTVPKSRLKSENYSMQDIRMLHELDFEVEVASSWREVSLNCDLYFSWWASGSVIPLLKALLCRRPIVVIAGGNEAMLYRDSISGKPAGYLAAPWYKRVATRLTLAAADRVLYVSRYMRSGVGALGAARPLCVHNGVDTERFTGGTGHEELVLSIMRLASPSAEIKRLWILIEALPFVVNRHPRCRVIIVGHHGDLYDEVRSRAKAIGIESHLILTGELPNEIILQWMRRAAVYVQISDTETFGMAIAEAMSCELPVVISARGAIPEVVGPDGIYVEHNDVKSVADGINRALALNPDERRAVGARLRSRICERFSYKQRKQAIKILIDELCYPIYDVQ